MDHVLRDECRLHLLPLRNHRSDLGNRSAEGQRARRWCGLAVGAVRMSLHSPHRHRHARASKVPSRGQLRPLFGEPNFVERFLAAKTETTIHRWSSGTSPESIYLREIESKGIIFGIMLGCRSKL